MALPAARERFTPEEYLRKEALAEIRHEYHAGEILAMSGGTYEHSRINTNFARSLGNRLEGSPCFVLDSNMRVRLAREDRYVYPDTMIVCGEPQFDPLDVNRTTILNPKIVVEVLSESTEAYGRGSKFMAYRDLDSMDEYVLIAQDRPQVETFSRQTGGNWLFAAWSGVGATVKLRTLDLQLPLAEIYSGLVFAGTDRSG